MQAFYKKIWFGGWFKAKSSQVPDMFPKGNELYVSKYNLLF